MPTYVFLRRRVPPVGIGIRLLGAGMMGMLGSFLGFTAGGAAAAMEVNRQMENPQQSVPSSQFSLSCQYDQLNNLIFVAER